MPLNEGLCNLSKKRAAIKCNHVGGHIGNTNILTCHVPIKFELKIEIKLRQYKTCSHLGAHFNLLTYSFPILSHLKYL